MSREEAQLEAKRAAQAFLMSEPDPPPILESEYQVASLLSWARAQESFLVHPGIVARGNRLAISMPVSAGSPLIGVKSEGYIMEASEDSPPDGGDAAAEIEDASKDPLQDFLLSGAKSEGSVADASKGRDDALAAECLRLTKEASKDPSAWPLRLALRLLKEANDPQSPHEAYLQSLAPRPQSPMMWSVTQANELQYLPAKRAVRDELVKLRGFYDEHLASGPLGPLRGDLVGFAALVASAGARAIEVQPGQRALLPLVELVCPPEGAVTAGAAATAEPVPPNSTLELEGDLVVVTAARDLQAGEVLTRDHALTHDELLLRHGLPAAPGSVRDDVVIWAGLSKEAAKGWQLKELRRELTTEPGPSAGSLIVQSSVKRGRKLSEAIGRGLVHASRVLSCEKESELHGVAEWARNERKASKGLAGLGAERRRACISNMAHAVEGYLKTFSTTAEQDEELLRSVKGNWKVAVAYRLEKKRILQDVLQLIERAKDKEVERRARGREETHLPAAVTGRQAAPAQRSFKKGGFAAAGDAGKAAAKAKAPAITKGAKVEVLKGLFAGTVGIVSTEPNSLGSVNLQLGTGKSVDYVSLDNLKLLEPAPKEEVNEEPEVDDAEVADASAPEPLEFASGAAEGTERVAEAVSPADLDAIFDMDDVDAAAESLAAKVIEATAVAEEQQEEEEEEEEPAAADEPAILEASSVEAAAAAVAAPLAEEAAPAPEVAAADADAEERQRVLLAMRDAGVDEEKVQKVMAALAAETGP